MNNVKYEQHFKLSLSFKDEFVQIIAQLDNLIFYGTHSKDND